MCGVLKCLIVHKILSFSNLAKQLRLKSEDSCFAETNFIGLVNYYCQKTRRSCDYKVVKRSGPSHNPM